MTLEGAPAEPVTILLVQGERDERDAFDPIECHSRESDPEDADSLLGQLRADGYAVRVGHTAEHARSLARGSPPDLVLIRARHPLREALDLVAEIRRGEWFAAGAVPIVVIVPRGFRIDILRAFEVGADDCLVAPVFYLELRARIRALIVRCRLDVRSPVVCAGPLAIDTAARAVTLEGRRSLALPRIQYELLLVLAREPQRVVSRSELTRRLWGGDPPGSSRTLDSHACRLRRALHAAHADHWIVSVRGVGYRLR